MKRFSLVLIGLAAIAFSLSVFAETRLAPLIGAVLLLSAIGYAMWLNKTDSQNSYRKAERAARRQRVERARERGADRPAP